MYLLPLRFKLLHDVKEVIVDLRLTTKLQLHLVKVGQGILHLRRTNLKVIKRKASQELLLKD